MATEKPYTIPVYPSEPERMRMMVTESKLGGYIVGGDPDTACPGLWDWLVDEYGVRSMIDVGCGEGHALRFFEERGCDVLGVDAIAQEHPRIVQHNYREGPFPGPGEDVPDYDLAWSCEFVEHVAEEHIWNFMETFALGRTVLITHATPGQGGWNHVNEQHADYWIRAFASIGYQQDLDLTEQTRVLARQHGTVGNYYASSGLAFIR